MWLFIHRPFEIWDFLGTIRIERLYMVSITIFWLLFHKKSTVLNYSTLALFFWYLCIICSDLLTPAGASWDRATEECSKYYLFTFLVITSIRTEKELKILLTSFCVIFFIYMLHSYWEFRHGRYIYRMGIIRMVGVDVTMNDPNTFGASVIYALPMLIPLWELKVKNILLWLGTKLFILASLGLSVLCIILTGSRSAFVALIFGSVLLVCISKHRIRLFLFFVLLAPLIWAVTPLSLKHRYLTLIDPSMGPASAQESAEGRWEGMIKGIEIWKKAPVIGVGPGKSRKFMPGKVQTHSFIGQVLSELGVIGMAVYLLIIFSVFMNYLKTRKYTKMYQLIRPPGDNYFHKVSIAVAFSVMELLLLGIGGHNAYRYTWIWYTAFHGIAVMILVNKVFDCADRENLKEEKIA
ncbi:MAG: O-antigen ligase family protein [Planctomycetaceae bacterium]|jgi:hypothetical protein|nr:O-antigen ligase family protein [Planctomycetaceae bacterium]